MTLEKFVGFFQIIELSRVAFKKKVKGCRWAASLRSERTERTRVWYSCRRVDTYICVLYGLLYDGSGDMKKEAAGDQARRTDTPLHG